MPDVLIRGMDKPGGCRECDFCEMQDINRAILFFCNRNDRFLDDEEACNIPNDCPIIELPEHVDLISRKQAFQMMLDRGYQKEAAGVILEVPTVIPSNKEV